MNDTICSFAVGFVLFLGSGSLAIALMGGLFVSMFLHFTERGRG